MIANKARPLPQGFSLVVAASGLRLSVLSGPRAAPVGTAGGIAYLVELRHGDDPELAVRFPYTPAIAPRTASEITLDDVLFAVAGDISATHRAHAGSPDAASTLWVPAERIADVAHALERALGPWRYRVLLAAYDAEERDWLTVLAAGFARPKAPPPSARRRRPMRDQLAQPSSARPTNAAPALTDAWNALRQASDDAERADGYTRTGEAFLGLGLSDAAADAFRGALRAAKGAGNAGLESRALIGQMAVAAATGREALFEWFRRAIPGRSLSPAVAAHYQATAEDGCRRFGRAPSSAPNRERPQFAPGSFADTSIVQAATEQAIQSLRTMASSIPTRDGRHVAPPGVAPIVRRLRATARLDRARGCGRAAAALTSRLSRGLAEASAAATRERLEHPRHTSLDPDTTGNRWNGAPAELELTLHTAQYASAVRAALAAGDTAWGGTAWLLGALEAAQHFGYALADSGAPAAADAWFLDLEEATAAAAPEFAAHVLTWRAGVARRAGRWAESDRLWELAERYAALVSDFLLSLAVGKARAQAILAIGNLGDAEGAFRELLARAESGTIASSGLTIALLNDLAITLERRADATADPVRRTERLIEAAQLVAQALTFGPGVLRPGQRELLVHNLGAFCVALGYLDTADRAFEAVLRSLQSGSFRAPAIVAGALSGRLDLAVRRGDRAGFARGVAKAAARWMEPRQRGIVLLATLRGWQRFGTPADVEGARAELEAHARGHRLNDLLTAVAERGPIDGVPATGGATGPIETTRDGDGFDGAIAAAVAVLSTAPDPARVTPGSVSMIVNLGIRHSPFQVLWRLSGQTAPLFAMPTAPEALRDAPHLIRAALAEYSANGRCEPQADPSVLDAIRAYGDALGSLQAYHEARVWLSAAIHVANVAHDTGLAGWALAWRAAKRRQGIRSGHGEEACRAAARDYRASLELASVASLRDLALFARHGLGAVALTRGRVADAIASLTPLAAQAQALGSRQVLAGVFNDLGTATCRMALMLDEREAAREYARGAEWYLRAVEAGQERLLPVQRDVLLLNLGGVASALGLHATAAVAADALFRTSAKDEHRTGAAVLRLRTAGACSGAAEVDRWVAWLDTRKVGPRLRAEILIATARAYQALGRLTAARSALDEATHVARGVPGRELALAVKREREQLTTPGVPFGRGGSGSVGSSGLAGITKDAIRALTRAPVGVLADWE